MNSLLSLVFTISTVGWRLLFLGLISPQTVILYVAPATSDFMGPPPSVTFSENIPYSPSTGSPRSKRVYPRIARMFLLELNIRDIVIGLEYEVVFMLGGWMDSTREACKYIELLQ